MLSGHARSSFCFSLLLQLATTLGSVSDEAAGASNFSLAAASAIDTTAVVGLGALSVMISEESFPLLLDPTDTADETSFSFFSFPFFDEDPTDTAADDAILLAF